MMIAGLGTGRLDLILPNEIPKLTVSGNVLVGIKSENPQTGKKEYTLKAESSGNFAGTVNRLILFDGTNNS